MCSENIFIKNYIIKINCHALILIKLKNGSTDFDEMVDVFKWFKVYLNLQLVESIESAK